MARWIITEDKINNGADVGKKSTFGEPKKSEAVKFRMKDDDGEVYYHGLCDDSETEDAFEPLDDFGMPNAGCTSIEYFENGKWSVL